MMLCETVLLAATLVTAKSPVDYVLPEMGTVNTVQLSTGNLYPLVSLPWGSAGWAPQTASDNRNRWFYDYTHTKICGIRETHQPSPWIADIGPWSFLPVVGRPGANPGARASWFSHKAETIRPDCYRVYLADYDTTVELAPTLRGAAVRITWPETDAPYLVVDPFPEGKVELSADGRRVVGRNALNQNRSGQAVNMAQRFVIAFDRASVASERLPDGALAVRFAPTRRGERLEAKIASSFVSDEQAAINLREVASGFDAVRAAATAAWEEALGRVKVESDDVDRLRVFFTCLYRASLFPRTFWDVDANGKVVHWSPSCGDVRSGYYYGGTGFWDTFRALFPLVNFLRPEMNAKMMAGLENCWKESGWLPEWSAPGLTDCMIGNNSASVVADAWLSGVRGDFDINELYKALLHGANAVHPKCGAVGRLGFAEYNAKGYVPRDIGVNESAARTLEYAYDDWCIARLGEALGRPADEVALYRKRSANWKNVFDPVRKIAVGRNADGSFNRDFNPFAWGGDFTEGCAHHYTWSVFHDVPGLVEAMGGKREFERRLDEIFTLPPTADCAYYKTVIHEAREMQVMNMGQYAHGNQPIQHMIYLYDWTDAPEKTRRRAHEAMARLYRPTPDGYCGDEDNGQTSAWYVWSAMGMYPVCPGSDEYALGLPLFDRAEVKLPNGKILRIVRAGDGLSGAASAEWNGTRLPSPFVSRTALREGGKLLFR